MADCVPHVTENLIEVQLSIMMDWYWKQQTTTQLIRQFLFGLDGKIINDNLKMTAEEPVNEVHFKNVESGNWMKIFLESVARLEN